MVAGLSSWLMFIYRFSSVMPMIIFFRSSSLRKFLAEPETFSYAHMN